MTLRSILAGLIALGLAGAGGCRDSEPKPGATPPQQGEPLFKALEPAPPSAVAQSGPTASAFPQATLPDGSAAPMAMVSDLASGWPVALQVGQSMTARLTADRATGARWALRAGSDAGVLRVEGEPVFEEKPGAPAVEVFQIKAAKAGKATLTFDLRKGASGAPLRTVSYPVTVQ